MVDSLIERLGAVALMSVFPKGQKKDLTLGAQEG